MKNFLFIVLTGIASICPYWGNIEETRGQEENEPIYGIVESPCFIELFTRADCPGCQKAAPEVEQVEREGATIRRVDVATEAGLARAKAEGVEYIPAAIVVGERREKVDAQTIAKYGFYRAAKAAIERATKPTKSAETLESVERKLFPETAKSGETPETLKTPEKPKTDENALSLEISDPPAPDFRDRAPVYEDIKEVGLFDESIERWRQKGGRDRYEEPGDEYEEEEPTPPRRRIRPQEPKDEEEESGRVGEGIAGRLAERIAPKIDESIKAAANQIEEGARAEIERQAANMKDAIEAQADGMAAAFEEKAGDAFARALTKLARRAGGWLLRAGIGVLIFYLVFSYFRQKREKGDK